MAEQDAAAKAPESVVEEKSALDSLLDKVDWTQAATAGDGQVEATRSKLSRLSTSSSTPLSAPRAPWRG